MRVYFCCSAQTEALAARVSEAEEAEASAKANLSIAHGSVASLEKALSAAEAEKVEAIRRLTRQGGDYVAVRGASSCSSRLVFCFSSIGLGAAVFFC